MIVIIDYGMGNLRSIENKLRRAGAAAKISSDIGEIEAADKLILPGVGAFASGMRNLDERALRGPLEKKALRQGTPTLGICLGMELITEWSEEGDAKGLGWIRGQTRRFVFEGDGKKIRVPHVGWNSLSRTRESPLLKGVSPDSSFYFVHSYHVVCSEPSDIVATTDYGYSFPSVIEHKNILGTQFHPEKSHAAGVQILKNFAEMA